MGQKNTATTLQTKKKDLERQENKTHFYTQNGNYEEESKTKNNSVGCGWVFVYSGADLW